MSCFSVEELYAVENKTNDGSLSLDQVYKIVVNWSNGQSTVIYRRYSMFFDFMVSPLNTPFCVLYAYLHLCSSSSYI